MNRPTRRLTRSALLAALGCALLYISAVIPSGRIALVAVSGLLTAAALIHCGIFHSIAVFATTAVLSAAIIPLKSCAVLYAVFLGYYPIAKSLFERLKSRVLEWVCKLALFNGALTCLWILGRSVFLPGEVPGFFEKYIILAYILMNLVFIVYDLGISKLISFYIIRISKHID
ncbi:MAG TPA: hypothetical protein GXZ52_07070 [Clostridiales bacterium]|jgi:hypothetical protein|nr:hypothetical protein [Clostridiales bacterium]